MIPGSGSSPSPAPSSCPAQAVLRTQSSDGTDALQLAHPGKECAATANRGTVTCVRGPRVLLMDPEKVIISSS